MQKHRPKLLNGYIIRYRPKHPKAITSDNYKGYVYEHVLVAEMNLGRFLHDGEEVHHLDQNKKHNSPENLIVLLASEHARLHIFLRKDPECSTSKTKRCIVCKFPIKNNASKYCAKCRKKYYNNKGPRLGSRKVKNRPSSSLISEDVAQLGWEGTGRKYGVTGNAVRKWVKTS